MDKSITISHVCSLGNFCQSSQILKETGLKKESYPFDWIFSSPANIINILEDDFTQFLNKELYEKMYSIKFGKYKTIDYKKCGHKIYHNKMFFHHNPKNNDNDYNYFIRCVDRFRKLLKKELNKLFVITFTNLTENIESIKKQIIELNNYISTKTSNYYIFVICHIPNQKIFKFKILDIDNIKFVLLYTKSRSNGIRIGDFKENEMLYKLLLDSYSFQIEKLE
jgi:hypothetical protein